MIYQQKCKALFASGRTREAIASLLVVQSDREMRKDVYQWLGGKTHTPSWDKRSEILRLDFKKQCLGASESLGDEAMRNGNRDDAVAWYSAALDLNPASPEHVFMKRSETHAASGSWEDALVDADEVYPIMDRREAHIQ